MLTSLQALAAKMLPGLAALFVSSSVLAAPQIDGDVIVANNHVGQLVVLPDGFKASVGITVKPPCLLGLCLPSVSVGVGVKVPNLFPPVNIHSVVLPANGHVMGNVYISGHLEGLTVVSSGSNINSVWASK
jgi:hypothetical protein